MFVPRDVVERVVAALRGEGVRGDGLLRVLRSAGRRRLLRAGEAVGAGEEFKAFVDFITSDDFAMGYSLREVLLAGAAEEMFESTEPRPAASVPEAATPRGVLRELGRGNPLTVAHVSLFFPVPVTARRGEGYLFRAGAEEAASAGAVNVEAFAGLLREAAADSARVEGPVVRVGYRYFVYRSPAEAAYAFYRVTGDARPLAEYVARELRGRVVDARGGATVVEAGGVRVAVDASRRTGINVTAYVPGSAPAATASATVAEPDAVVPVARAAAHVALERHATWRRLVAALARRGYRVEAWPDGVKARKAAGGATVEVRAVQGHGDYVVIDVTVTGTGRAVAAAAAALRAMPRARGGVHEARLTVSLPFHEAAGYVAWLDSRLRAARPRLSSVSA